MLQVQQAAHGTPACSAAAGHGPVCTAAGPGILRSSEGSESKGVDSCAVYCRPMSQAPQRIAERGGHPGAAGKALLCRAASAGSGAAVPVSVVLKGSVGVISIQHSALSACCRPVSPVRRREPRRDTPPRRSRRSPSPPRGRRRGDSPRRRASPPRKRTRTPPAKVLQPSQSAEYAAGRFTWLTSCVMCCLCLLLWYIYKYDRDVHALLRQAQLDQHISCQALPLRHQGLQRRADPGWEY